MTPPEATPGIPNGNAGAPQPAVSVCLEVMRKRKDFVAASRARRKSAKGLLLQARNRHDEDPQIRVGFTCTKKVGNAVSRNRAKRRLREIARLVLPLNGQKGWDYVLIGRAQITAERPFTDLTRDLKQAVLAIHTGKEQK